MIKGKKIELKNVVIEDADYIVTLRQNEELNKYISKTSSNIESQKIWIKEYLKRNKRKEEYYFIIYNKIKNCKCGTIRIYNIDYSSNSATWGSFILEKNRPDGSANEVIKLTLDFIFKTLNLKIVNLDVRKENLRAIHIYKKFGFIYLKSDDDNEYYKLDINDYLGLIR